MHIRKWATFSIIFIFILVLFPWIILDGFVFFGHTIRISRYADLADFVSGITAPFLGLVSILLLIKTLQLQQHQLNIQSSSINEQQKDIKAQQKLFERQQFESVFFNLINTHNNIVSAIDLKKKRSFEVMVSNRDALRYIYAIFQKHCQISAPTKGAKISIDEAMVSYDLIQERYKSDLHHYYRFVYQVLKFIKHSFPEDTVERKRYVAIYRALFSSHELSLIFYNCLHDVGVKKFKPLVEDLHFFNNLNDPLLINEEHKNEFNGSAFAGVDE